MTESVLTFDCFGGTCTVAIAGRGPLGAAAGAVETVRLTLLDWNDRFSRFQGDSELSRLNADPRVTVAASPLMVRLAQATADAGRATGGLVDATLAAEIEDAGYVTHFAGEGIPLREALSLAPARRPAGPAPMRRWAEILTDPATGRISRPADVRLDSGGLAKGLFADVLAEQLADYDSFVANLCGDLRMGGRARVSRRVDVESPFDRRVLHAFELRTGAVATSGIGRCSWLNADAQPAHHILDPATGRPAFTGLVQVTALAPTGLEAEWRSKAALLAGPARARDWLPHGGVVVLDNEDHAVIFEAQRELRLRPRVTISVDATSRRFTLA